MDMKTWTIIAQIVFGYGALCGLLAYISWRIVKRFPQFNRFFELDNDE